MSKKRNAYLDASDEEEDIGNDSNAEEDTRFGALPSKRRKLGPARNDYEESEDEGSQDERPQQPNKEEESQPKEKAAPLKPLTPAEVAASNAKARKTGVIYISRIPPFMKPSVVRNLLERYGEIHRIFLTPEPTPAYQKRVRSGGNKKRSFVDGWVEFASKKKAKIVAETLNGNIIGGKRGSWYHDDIWNIKYLRGFKWSDLMEQVQNEEREREGRLRMEIEKEGKQRKAFLHNLELDKKQKGMERKRRKARKRSPMHGSDGDADPGGMTFRQKAVKAEPKQEGSIDEVRRVLGKIF